MTVTIPGKQRLQRYMLPCLLVLMVISGCSSTKTVPEGDALFAGYKVKVDDKNDSSKRTTALKTELNGTVRPQPNANIFGLRFKLWIYNAFYTEKEKGLKNWIQNKVGEPPVLLSMVDTNSVAEVMSNRLHNRGYFVNTVKSETAIKKKKANITWTASVGEPYRLRKIEYTLNDSLPVHRDIARTKAESTLVEGEPYDLDKLTLERTRVDGNLKERGYFYFNPEMLIFSVDTTIWNRQADVLMRLKSNTPSQALRTYTVDDVYIMANYMLGDSMSVQDTIDVRGYHYIPDENYVKAKHLLNGVFVEKDSLYRRQNQLLTVRRLSGLSAYKFANLDFEPDTTRPDKLDAFIYLTPSVKKSLRAEAQMVTKSNNFAGPGLTVAFRNRNAFKGSEMLNVEFTGNLETQVGGGRGTGTPPEGEQSTTPNNLTSFELGVRSTLAIPRIVSPFKLPNLRTEFVPQTRISAGFNMLNRVQYFRMNSVDASYGYNWRPRQTVTHDITPINLQYVHLANTTELFDSLLLQLPFLARSFENQFIIGSMYQHNFSTQMFEQRRHQFYNNFKLDVSGNILNAVQSLLGADAPGEDAPRTIFKQRYSQYTRLENDFRYYFKLSKDSQIATRLIAGIGMPYGNSNIMPYVKQFSIGGPNSIRAFRARSIGPGTYPLERVPVEGESMNNNFSYFDQTGDIKLEANVEYRFPIAGFFKGALFVDAGNVWDLREQEGRPGGEFESNKFLSELGVGTGFGLRVDIEFFVIRLDFGVPVRIPYREEGERFVLPEFRPKFSGENGIVMNIAIGYPF